MDTSKCNVSVCGLCKFSSVGLSAGTACALNS